MSSRLSVLLEPVYQYPNSLAILDDDRMHISGKPDMNESTFLPPVQTTLLDTDSITQAPAASSTSMSSITNSEPDNYRELECTICTHPIGTPLPPSPFATTEPLVETAVTLPCGHIYGDLCIAKWLEQKSMHQDCPDCRRRMVHKGCGHFVVPRVVGRAPRVLGWSDAHGEKGNRVRNRDSELGDVGIRDWYGEGGLEGECLRCRGSRVVAEMVRSERERLELEERVVKGLWEGLRSVFGMNGGAGIGGKNGNKIVRERVEERRREFEKVWDGAWEIWEREEGMRRW